MWRVVSDTPMPLFPVTEPVPIVQDAGWSSGKLWTGQKNLTPPRYDPRTLHPVGSHYTHCAIPAHATGVVEYYFPLQKKNLNLPTWYPTISFALLPSQNGISNIFHSNRTSIPFRSLPRLFRPPLHHFLSFQSPLRFPLQMLYCTK